MEYTIFEDHLQRQIEFSDNTFGPGDRMYGIIDHISKELDEIVGGNNDPEEWVDVVILGLDGLWRSLQYPIDKEPYDSDELAMLMAKMIKDKQSINEQRDWPDWQNMDHNKAIEHDRSND